jgi:hypothetical protein
VHGGTIQVNALLQAPGSVITLHASTAATQTAALIADRLSLNGAGDFTLTNSSNNVATIAGGSPAAMLGSVAYTDAADGLSIGDVGPLQGIHASGKISVTTLSGNLNLTRPVVSDFVGDDAVLLYASRPSAVDDPEDGDIIVSGTGAVTIDSGARALLYSGSAATSTGLSDLASTPGNVRTRVDQNTDLTQLSPAVGSTGIFVLYRVEGVAPETSGGNTTSSGNRQASSSAITATASSPELAATGVPSSLGLFSGLATALLVATGIVLTRRHRIAPE